MALTQASPPKFLENRRAAEAQQRWEAATSAVRELLAEAGATSDEDLAAKIVETVKRNVTTGPAPAIPHGDSPAA